MDAACPWNLLVSFVLASSLALSSRAFGATFTFVNSCQYTIWPGVLSNAGSLLLANGGFELQPGQSAQLEPSTGWSGRFWGRTGCSFSSSGEGTCASGDCGGKLQCSGAGAATPATLAEFTLAGMQSNIKQDFYDVSLVDGYNIPITVTPKGGSGTCGTAGCSSDLNLNCPSELQDLNDGGVVGCKSACNAFQSPQYCCQGAYANPTTCQPSVYSEIFKTACPNAYSYAYDDPTSTFTCTAAPNYSIVFCPNSPSQKSTTGVQPVSNAVDSGASASAGAKTEEGKRLVTFMTLFLGGVAVLGASGWRQ